LFGLTRNWYDEGAVHIEVDQSGKIEQTNLNTVLAFSDGDTCNRTILIKAREKRILITTLRNQGKTGVWFYTRIYVASLYILLKPALKKVTGIWIDDEYSGKQKIIKSLLVDFAKREGIKLEWDKIDFRLIGRKSKAHQLAIDTLRGKIEPDEKISAENIIKTLEK